jgi:hypothetical protein
MLIAALVAAVAAITVRGVVFTYAPARSLAAYAQLPSYPSSYLGMFQNGSRPAYHPIARFAKAVGRSPNIAGYDSDWGQPFATVFAQRVRRHDVIPYVQMEPTGTSLSAIAAGRYDGYLHSYADSVRNFSDAVVIGFGREMNTPRYSWGYGHVPPSAFVAAWRHVVTLFRAQGAENVTWLWTVGQDRPGTGRVAAWWPGASYVTWVGIDGHYRRPSDTFAGVFGRTIDQVREFTGKPVLLSETAVTRRADRSTTIRDLFHGMREYRTLGLVWLTRTRTTEFPRLHC